MKSEDKDRYAAIWASDEMKELLGQAQSCNARWEKRRKIFLEHKSKMEIKWGRWFRRLWLRLKHYRYVTHYGDTVDDEVCYFVWAWKADGSQHLLEKYGPFDIN